VATAIRRLLAIPAGGKAVVLAERIAAKARKGWRHFDCQLSFRRSINERKPTTRTLWSTVHSNVFLPRSFPHTYTPPMDGYNTRNAEVRLRTPITWLFSQSNLHTAPPPDLPLRSTTTSIPTSNQISGRLRRCYICVATAGGSGQEFFSKQSNQCSSKILPFFTPPHNYQVHSKGTLLRVKLTFFLLQNDRDGFVTVLRMNFVRAKKVASSWPPHRSAWLLTEFHRAEMEINLKTSLAFT
jgi:hypothetical protein